MQINRLFEIVYILLEKKNVTAQELAQRFEVSTRTVYRDIELLSGAGIPIYTVQGKGGGISLLDNFVLDKTTISEEEQEQILLALNSLSETQQKDVGNIFSRLCSLFNKSGTDWIEIDFGYWNNNIEFEEKFDILKQSVLKNKIIEFTYNSTKGEKTYRTVEPLKLIFKGQSWYLYAFCKMRNDNRFFKLTRITNIKLTEKSFIRKNTGRVCNKSYNDRTMKNYIDIVLRFNKSVSFRVYDEFEDITENADGSFTVKATLPENEWLYSYLLSFQNNVTILEPESIKNKMKSIISSINKNYI